MFFRRFLIIAAVGCAVPAMWAQGTPASFTNNYVFPPVGLGSTETASVTVVNRATAFLSSNSRTSSPPAVAPSCTGTISFSNANGVIGTPTPFTVGSEQLKTVTQPFTGAGLTGIRGEIQATVSLTISTSMRAACSLAMSLETYDTTTGATHAFLTNSMAGGGPIVPVAAPLH